MRGCNLKSKVKIILFIIIPIFLVLVGRYFLLRSNKPMETYIEEIKEVVEDINQKATNEIVDNYHQEEFLNEQEKEIPTKIQIDVPFSPQAPLAVWDERHKEACEEMSLIMIYYYLQGKKLDRKLAEEAVQKMIDFQLEKYGDYKDSNAAQIVRLAEDYYGLKNLKVIYDFSQEEIKKQLAFGKPIIVPAAGRELGNPYYTPPGPLYHMLVLTGYSENQIITNDAGTRRGQNYRYDIDVLYKAIHDFPGTKDNIKEGRKAMIVITD